MFTVKNVYYPYVIYYISFIPKCLLYGNYMEMTIDIHTTGMTFQYVTIKEKTSRL